MFIKSIQPSDDGAMTARPRRDRANEASEQQRQSRFDAGVCRTCTCSRKRTKGAFCTQHYNEVTRNTKRFRGTGRVGRMSIDEMDADDLRQAIRAICTGAAGLDALKGQTHLNRRERQQAKAEPLAQISLAARYLVVGILKRNGLLEEYQECIEANLDDE